MRFTVAALLERGVAAGADLRLDGAQHAVRRRPLRPLPARPDAHLPRRAGLLATSELAPLARGAGAVSATAKPKLAVWKFASCDGCQLSAARLRGRAARARRRGRDRLLPRGDERRRRGPVRPLARRGLDHDRRTTPSGSSEVRRAVEGAGHDRRLRDRRRDPGAAQLRRRATSSSPPSTPRPSTSRRSRPRRRSPRTCRSTSSCTAARSTSASCSRSSPRSCTAASPASRRRASASSASGAAPSASWSPTARRASARSPTPAAARSARPTTAAATAASGRWRRRTPRRSSPLAARLGLSERDVERVFRTFNANAAPFREAAARHG